MGVSPWKQDQSLKFRPPVFLVSQKCDWKVPPSNHRLVCFKFDFYLDTIIYKVVDNSISDIEGSSLHCYHQWLHPCSNVSHLLPSQPVALIDTFKWFFSDLTQKFLGLIPDSTLRNYSLQCLGDHMECWGMTLSWLCTRHTPYLLHYLSSSCILKFNYQTVGLLLKIMLDPLG